ncbi:LPS export ABC transporter periplasmic protein LptC [Qipengyuania sp. JC766]|uniref:LPS export ABC transporter periplasmic protein LptC n=1 Tax=Qipengyuania sp. JC766 TaxID=3232139 RepID=UPI0034573FEE
MATSRRIETAEAKALRSKRQHFATPGGFHDRLIKALGTFLPMGVGVLAAFMVITPLSPRGEVSFLLDRNEVAVIDERLSVENAMYRGQDDESRPFSLTAGEAIQRSTREGIVRMQDLVARLLMNDGPARISAPGGRYDIDRQFIDIDGEVQFRAADDYTMFARGVNVDLQGQRMLGTDGVSGSTPAGTFSADRLEADLQERTVTLEGNARLRMIPKRVEDF